MPNFAWSYLTVAVGGALGAVARFGLTGLLHSANIAIPAGTFASNLLGCFLMGIVAELVATSAWFHDAGFFPDHYRLLFAVGFCGAFTTLSALVLEMSTMMQRNDVSLAFAYLVVTLVGGFAAFHGGALLLKLLTQTQGG